MKRFVLVIAIFSFVMAACTPKSTPVPPPPSAVTPPPIPITSATDKGSNDSKDAAWARVVAEAKKEGRLTIYSFNFIGDVGTAFRKTFEERYGIKVDIVAGIGMVLIERLKNEQKAKQYTADLLDSAVSYVNLAKQEGMTQPYGYLPVLEEKDVWNIHPKADTDGHLLGVRPGITTPYINTKLVKLEEAPKSFKALLEPQWKKKIVIDSPAVATMSVWMYLAMRKAGIFDDDYWRQLAKQDLIVAPSYREIFVKLMLGEAHIAMDGSDGGAAPFVKEGAPIKAIMAEEGVLVVPYSAGIAIIKNAPHPNAARLFMNWISSQEGENTYSQAAGGITTYRKDVPDYRPAAIKVDLKKIIPIDLDIILETTKVQQEGKFAEILGVKR